jgi:hypothetical protein
MALFPYAQISAGPSPQPSPRYRLRSRLLTALVGVLALVTASVVGAPGSRADALPPAGGKGLVSRLSAGRRPGRRYG